MPMIQHNKLVQLVSGSLLRHAEVQALVGNRVHGGWARDTDLQSIPCPKISFVLDGGLRHYEGVYGEYGLEIWCLSADSESECRTLYDAVSDALKAECLVIDGLDHRGQAFENDVPRAGWLETQSLWHLRARWTLHAARTTIGAVT